MNRIRIGMAEAALKIISGRRQQWLTASPSLATLVNTVPGIIGDLDETAEQLDEAKAERTRAVDALSDVGRTAEAASGDLEDGINAELTAARAESEHQAVEVEHLRAELDAIRTRDEPTGSVLYDVVRSAAAGRLDEHEAVRQIEERVVAPLVARERRAVRDRDRASRQRSRADTDRARLKSEALTLQEERDAARAEGLTAAARLGETRAKLTAVRHEKDALAERMAVVEKFVAGRAEYITAITNCHPDNYADYHRWQGHAEGRRQLAQDLGLPVAWPPGYESDAPTKATEATADCGHCECPLIKVGGTWLHGTTGHEECRPDTEPVVCAAPVDVRPGPTPDAESGA